LCFAAFTHGSTALSFFFRQSAQEGPDILWCNSGGHYPNDDAVLVLMSEPFFGCFWRGDDGGHVEVALAGGSAGGL